MTTEEKEEDSWFKSVQNKLRKRITNPMWDSLNLTKIEWDSVIFLAKAKTVNDLPVLLNERMVENLLKKIDIQFKQMKGKEI